MNTYAGVFDNILRRLSVGNDCRKESPALKHQTVHGRNAYLRNHPYIIMHIKQTIIFLSVQFLELTRFANTMCMYEGISSHEVALYNACNE